MPDTPFENPYTELVDSEQVPIITALTGSEYLATISPDGSGGFVPKKILTSNMGINSDGGLLYKEVTLNRSQIQSLNSSPIEFIAAPGEGKSITFSKCLVSLDPDGTQFTFADSNNYVLYFNYETSERACALMGGVFLSSSTAYRGSATINLGYSTNPNYNMALNEAVVITNPSTDYTGGGVNAFLKVLCWYQIIDFS